MHIHGKQKQAKRLEIYQKFTSSSSSVLFATDVAARGLDFPSVNWVVQLDCPEDVDTYVHRVGRTARYNSKGKALLMLLPSEESGFLGRLKEKRLDALIKPIKANAAKQQTVQKQFQSLAFQFPEIKFLAQRAFISYTRSVYLQKDKKTFDVNALPLDKYAQSLGLAGTPKIKFVSKKEASDKKNKAREVEKLKAAKEAEDGASTSRRQLPALLRNAEESEDSEGESSDDEATSSEDEEHEEETLTDKAGQPVGDGKTPASAAAASRTTKYDKMYKRKNQGILSEHYQKLVGQDEEGSRPSTSLLGADDDQEDFITLARVHHALPEGVAEQGELAPDRDGEIALQQEDLSKRRQKLGMTKKGLQKLRGTGEKLRFDDEGGAHPLYELMGESEMGDVEAARRAFVQQEAERMKDVDVLDKEAIKELKREKKRKRKEREREVDGEGRQAFLAAEDDDNGVVDIDFGSLSDRASDDENEPVSGKRRKAASQADSEEEIDLEEMALQKLRKGRR